MISTKTYSSSQLVKTIFMSYEYNDTTQSVVLPSGYKYQIAFGDGTFPEVVDLTTSATNLSYIFLETTINNIGLNPDYTKSMLLNINGQQNIIPISIDAQSYIFDLYNNLLIRLYQCTDSTNIVIGLFNIGTSLLNISISNLQLNTSSTLVSNINGALIGNTPIIDSYVHLLTDIQTPSNLDTYIKGSINTSFTYADGISNFNLNAGEIT